jgi:translation initiation factor IF-2
LAKNLKLTIKNTQIAEAINLGSLKSKLAKKKSNEEPPVENAEIKQAKALVEDLAQTAIKDDAPRVKARSRSAFSEGSTLETKQKPPELSEELPSQLEIEEPKNPVMEEVDQTNLNLSEELRQDTFKDELEDKKNQPMPTNTVIAEKTEQPKIKPVEKPFKPEKPFKSEKTTKTEKVVKVERPVETLEKTEPQAPIKARPRPIVPVRNIREEHAAKQAANMRPIVPLEAQPTAIKLGPTGRHMRDLVPPPRPVQAKPEPVSNRSPNPFEKKPAQDSTTAKPKPRTESPTKEVEDTKGLKTAKTKEFRDIKPTRKPDQSRSFDGRDRQGLSGGDDDRGGWRKRRQKQSRVQEDTTIRPTSLKVRVPISIKDLAVAMKLKSSQLIAKLFLQGLVMTLNDSLDDEVTLHMLGSEFGCELTIDSTEEERIRITDKTVKEEIALMESTELTIRPPIVAFMGHVDHGKTSLIDFIRNSNRAAGEAGAITQHIGAFRCKTNVGPITVLDTPGHEAFSAMRARGADVTDIVVLVVAGDEGIRQQTIEAIQHAKAAKVTIVVAINKSDKPNFNAENVYRQLSEQDLLPESWGGQTITVNCSAVTGEGIPELLEMLALQAEVLELKANPNSRARGTVLESEMHKGMGSVATVLVQNGTLKIGDSIVFSHYFGRVKTIQDEFGNQIQEAPPSAPVAITGLSGLPEAGQEFITVKSEKEAREISEARILDKRESNLLLKKKVSMENLLQQSAENTKKMLNIVLRADVQGSLEAIKVALQKIESDKAELTIIFAGVGEISESDVQLAAASKAVIVGFHTHIESHADLIVKQLGVQVKLHDIIYHAIDDVKLILAGLLDKIAIETDKGKAEVRATFKSSHHGIIAGCYITEGIIQRNNIVRVIRNKAQVHKGTISSLKRIKEDVREVAKGFECGIILNNFELQEGDILEAFEVTYITQAL